MTVLENLAALFDATEEAHSLQSDLQTVDCRPKARPESGHTIELVIASTDTSKWPSARAWILSKTANPRDFQGAQWLRLHLATEGPGLSPWPGTKIPLATELLSARVATPAPADHSCRACTEHRPPRPPGPGHHS